VKTARKAALFVSLIALTLVEIYFCTAFLPAQWQHALNDRTGKILPKSHDWTPTTHPLLSQEIEQVLGDHIGVRIALYVVKLALLIGNGLFIRWLWLLLRSTRNLSDDREFLSGWVPVRTCPARQIRH
jgi:hypothetical protein